MDIRVNDSNCLEQGLSLVEETWPEWVPLPETLRAARSDGILEHHRKKLQQTGAFFVATIDSKKLIGFAIMLPDKLGYHLNFIAVTEKRRGQGIARALLDKSVAEARKRGAKEVSTGTWSSNIAARNLYEGRGFLPTQTIRDDRGPGIDSVYYKLLLDSPH